MKKLFAVPALVCFALCAFANDLTFTVVNSTPGFTTGSIDLNVSGGIAPFTYSWTGPGGFTANTEDLSGLATGTYTVTVTDAYCGIAATTVFVDNATGIDENTNAASFSVFPNPAKDLVMLASGTALKNADLKVIDLTGKIISQSKGISGNTVTLNISGQPKGIYFIEIISEGAISRKRFVKD